MVDAVSRGATSVLEGTIGLSRMAEASIRVANLHACAEMTCGRAAWNTLWSTGGSTATSTESRPVGPTEAVNVGIPWDFHSSGVLSPVILSEAQPECPVRGPLADRFGATRMSQRGRQRSFDDAAAVGRACVKTLGSGQRSDKMRVPIPHGPLSHEAIRRG